MDITAAVSFHHTGGVGGRAGQSRPGCWSREPTLEESIWLKNPSHTSKRQQALFENLLPGWWRCFGKLQTI